MAARTTSNIQANYSIHSMFQPQFLIYVLKTGNCGIAMGRRMDLKQRLIGLPQTQNRVAISVLISAVFLIISWFSAFSQSASGNGTLPASELLRKAVGSELKAQSTDHTHWMYQEKTENSRKEQVKWVVETHEGDLDRLWLMNGRPITREQQGQEDRRIERLLHKPGERRKQQRAQEEDARQTERLFKMLPDAVTAKFGERKEGLVEILFQPNPNFHPSSHEAAVFHAMEGRIWIDGRENRLAEIEGHLIRPVKFYGGVLGHLDEGGKFHVKQSEVAQGHWEITLLNVNMRGKALFFKTISVQQYEIRSNFQPVPDNLTLAQAAEELHRQCTAQATANIDERRAFDRGERDQFFSRALGSFLASK